MSDKKKLYQERLNRYVTAMDVGKPDRVPIRFNSAGFLVNSGGYTLQEVYYQMRKTLKVQINSLKISM